MDPSHMEWMAGAVRRRRYLYCPDGSHLALYEDQATYFSGLIEFIHDVSLGCSRMMAGNSDRLDQGS
jgi:proline iminopeptidase